jgi:hypothetical protein
MIFDRRQGPYVGHGAIADLQTFELLLSLFSPKPFTVVGSTVGGLSTHRTQEPLKGEIFANKPQMSRSNLYEILQHYVDSLIHKLPESAGFHG